MARTSWLSVKQVSLLKQVTVQAIYQAIEDGRLVATRIGSFWVVERKDLDQWHPRQPKAK